VQESGPNQSALSVEHPQWLVRLGSTPFIEHCVPNLRFGVESGYSLKPPE